MQPLEDRRWVQLRGSACVLSVGAASTACTNLRGLRPIVQGIFVSLLPLHAPRDTFLENRYLRDGFGRHILEVAYSPSVLLLFGGVNVMSPCG